MTDRYECELRSASSLGDYSTKSRDMDRHVTPIAMVFDELKDYLSESDLSLDYKIARSRNKKKKLLTNRNSKIFNGDVVVKPQQGRSSSVPPPCNRRTESSRHRVKQYTDKLLSIQGAKYRNQEEVKTREIRGSPTKSCDLAPIPEERNSMLLEHE